MGMSVPGNSCKSKNCTAPTSGAGCLFNLSGQCIYYSGSTISSLGINTGDNLDTVINKLASYISFLVGTIVLNFRIGDGGTYTPTAGSSTFNPTGNPLIGKTVLGLFGGGLFISPGSAANPGEFNWSFVSPTGVLTLANGTFDDATVYSIWYK